MPDNPNLTLVIGGARSGKSSHGERLIEAHEPPWNYIATAQALDEEMERRISAHQKRRDEHWQTIEAPLDLVSAIGRKCGDRPVLIDCLTLWLTNHMMNGGDLERECQSLATFLYDRAGTTVVITNEVGQGIVPADAMTREFRDAAGRLNQMIASVSGSVVQMVAGIAVKVK